MLRDDRLSCVHLWLDLQAHLPNMSVVAGSGADTPGVSGAELRSVSFLQARHSKWRLDTAPFYVVYPAVVLAASSGAFSDTK